MITVPLALNSFVNARRLRLAMTHSYRTFVRFGGVYQIAAGSPPCMATTSRRVLQRPAGAESNAETGRDY
jgi:hypothetical protein